MVQRTVEAKKGDVKAVLERGDALAPEKKFKSVSDSGLKMARVPVMHEDAVWDSE